jgi:hypothetical protein
VQVTESGGNRVRIELSVSKNDMGRVIGKGGKVANAIRALLRVAAERRASKPPGCYGTLMVMKNNSGSPKGESVYLAIGFSAARMG